MNTVSEFVRSSPDALDSERIIDLNIYSPPGLEKDYYAAWKTLQDDNPDIVWTDVNEGHWVALRGEIIAEILADHERFSSRMIIVPRSVAGDHSGMIPTTIDPPEHRWYRKQLNNNLSLKFVRQLEDDIRGLAGELIDGFKDDGQVNFTTAFAHIFPIRIFLTLLDLPQSDAQRLKYLADQLTKVDTDMTFAEAMDALGQYVLPVVEARMKNPGDDLISRMVGQPFEGRQMTTQEALMLVMQVIVAGLDTVVNFLGHVMYHLATHDELRAELVENPARIPLAVSEFFRRYGMVTIARVARQDMEFHGVNLREGDIIACPTVLHGIDEQQNECPMHFDMDRQRPRHVAFGDGPHRCPGQELARTEVTIAIQEWLKRIPDFRVPADKDIEYKGGIVGHIDTVHLEWDA